MERDGATAPPLMVKHNVFEEKIGDVLIQWIVSSNFLEMAN
jgi:hypothetical protein